MCGVWRSCVVCLSWDVDKELCYSFMLAGAENEHVSPIIRIVRECLT